MSAIRSRGRVRNVIEALVVIGAALLVALLVRTFLFQAFYIPSASMEPTLEVGDRVLVNKLSYDLHDVHRGDLVVFQRPEDDVTPVGIDDLIKRVIALPGESVEVADGAVRIDGVALDEPYLESIEGIPDFGPTRVPDDHVFVMGDNRRASRDSRSFGPVSREDIVGRAFLRIWPPSGVGLL